MPNVFAYLMLFIWPLLAIKFFRKKTLQQAVFYTIFGAYMFLSNGVNVDLPVIPALDKTSIAALITWYGCVKIAKRPIRFLAFSGITNLLIIIYFISPLISSAVNTDPIIFPWGLILPADSAYNGISLFMAGFIKLVPFFIGYQVYKTTEDHLELLKMLITSALLYSILILIEIRFSPQLNTWIYGFNPHSFLQQMRGSGFRAMVFMGHGLLVAIYLMVCISAASAFWKLKINAVKYSPFLVLSYLTFTMVLQKSSAALIYSIISLILIRFSPTKLTFLFAKTIAILALSYPILSLMNLVPYEDIINLFGGRTDERAASLAFRFDNEILLLDHARERFLLGWGGWGRGRIYVENPSSNEFGTTDGLWIITLGAQGFIGFAAQFGLLALPIFRASSALKFANTQTETTLLAAHAMILSLLILDQIPNASLLNWVWILAGGLLGYSDFLIKRQTDNAKVKSLNRIKDL